MTDFNPFGPPADPAESAPAPVVEAEEKSGNKKAVLGLGALAAVVLGAGAFLFLGGSGDEELDDFTLPPRKPAAAAPAPSATPAAKLPAVAKVALGRNPFRALYIQPAAAPAVPETPTGAAPAPADPGAVAPATGGTAPGTGTPAQEPTAKEYKLVLLRVFGEGADQSAVFSIDGKQQTAKVGTTFGAHAEILLIELTQGPKEEQWTAVLQVGDGDPFDVVTGVPAYVR
jgi:hypothetical protein